MKTGRELDRRTRITLILFLLVLVGFSAYRLWLGPPPGPYVAFSGRTMGTTYEVKVASEITPQTWRAVATAIEGRLTRVDGLMSTYDPASEISRFNARQSSDLFQVSPETLSVLQASQKVSELSDGAFDVTVGPLVQAWGFGATDRLPQPPEETELAELRERVGWRLLEIDAAAGALRKTHPAAEVDLSAIAKGYGVDQVAEALEELGHHDYLIEVGGELRAKGRKLDGALWRVAVERPSSGQREIHQVIPLADRAMATSGDYRNYYEEDGVRISHTIDPRTGRPIQHPLASVTVLHQSAMYADALATALNVLGPETGYTLAVKEGLAAYFITRESPDHFASRPTPAFQPLLEESKPAAGAP